MKSVGTRFLIPFGMLALLMSGFVLYQAYETSRKHSNDLISNQAAMALEFNLAIRDYVAGRIRPAIESISDRDYFVPEAMSTSFVARSIFEKVRQKFPEYMVRFSSDRPRNPLNQAGPDELKMIEFFRRNPQEGRRTEEITIAGKRYLAHFAPKYMSQSCLRCHSEPGQAPADLVRVYGAEASFHRKVGDIAGLDMIAAPLDEVDAPLTFVLRSQMLALAGGLVSVFAAILLIFKLVVTRRLHAMAHHFNEIASSPESSGLKPLGIKGTDEISSLGIAFNKLVEQLAKSRASLEQRVAERTDELRRANEELQLRLSERNRMENALLESQQQLADIIDFLPDATFVVDDSGRVIAWNRSMEEMTGLKAEDILGRGDHEYSLPFRGVREPLLIDLVLKPEKPLSVRCETPKRKDGILIGEALVQLRGEQVFLSATASALRDSKGNVVGAIESLRDISFRRKTQAALAESEQRFSVFMENLPAGVFIKDEANRVVFANRFLKELFGWGQVLNKTTTELLPSELSESMAADDRRVLKEGCMVFHERVTDVHGAERFFDTIKFPIPSAAGPALLAGIAVEVTDYKMAVEKLQRRTEELDRFFAINLDLLCITKDDGRFVRLSQAWEKTLGFELEELASWSSFDLVHPGDMDATREATERLKTRKELTGFVNRYRCKDGGYRWIEWHAAFAGDLIYAAARDVTERIRDQEEKERLEVRLRHAHKMEAVGTLAGGIAHDFNNILAAIIGYAEMALGEAPLPLQRYLNQVLHAGLRAKDLVRQILSFSRMRQSQELLPVSVGSVVTEALKLLRASLPSTIEIRHKVHVSSSVALADETEIHQVVVNLCANASQAMEEQGGLLQVTLDEIVAQPDDAGVPGNLKPGRYLKLSVGDTGHGIEPEIMDRIFDPYFTTKGIGKGNGLGLAVVHGIVERHQGLIEVDSKPGVGTVFSVYLPKIDCDLSGKVEPEVPIPGGTERVLYVDDEEVLVDLGKHMLEQLGYKVCATTGSVEALEKFRAAPESFDLIITDYTMPHMTGSDLAMEAMRIRSNIPVIVCTGFTERLTELQARGMGIRALLMKPLKLSELAGVIRRVLDGGS
ncbi:MAG: PAS domain S-box protein [Desulfobacteraceae bacterium]|nr:PAS domain S-box protein [Desulfobacteraceae bacterium]